MDKFMKTQTKTTPITSGFNPRRPKTDTRRIPFRSFLPAALLAGAALLGSGVNDVHAQPVFSCMPGALGGPFLPGLPATWHPSNDQTPSMGVFQIYVLSDYASGVNDMFDPGTVGGTPYSGAYPGWTAGILTPCIGGCPASGLAGWLTSPIIYDTPANPPPIDYTTGTVIGRSVPNQRPTPFPQQVGDGTAGPGTHTDTLLNGIPNGYAVNYPTYPLNFVGLPGSWEILTEIEHFTLSLPGGGTNCGCGNPLVPCPTLLTAYAMVLAGQYNADPSFVGPLKPSLGMVETLANNSTYNTTWGIDINNAVTYPNYEFPAQSFFNIYAEVHLPLIPSVQVGLGTGPTVSSVAFPAHGLYLYTDPNMPLVVQNSLMCALPPSVVYTHTPQTFAVGLYFKENGPINPNTHLPWWTKDALFGYLSLAGHGTLAPCSKSAEQTLVSTVLGTNNGAVTGAPIGWPLPNSKFPWPTMTFDSLHGTNSGGLSFDAVQYTTGTVSVWVRALSLGSFLGPTNLPAANSSVVYTNHLTSASCELSLDGINFSPGTASGQMSVLISNTNKVLYGASFYNLQVLSLNLSGSTALFGNFYMKQSATKTSFGTEIVQPSGGAYRIASSFDLNPTFSSDNVNFYQPNKPLHLQLANPPCGAAIEKVNVKQQGSSVIIWWYNPSYTLYGSPSLTPPNWTAIPGTSPITNSAAGPYHFYKLSCD
jgi:hypothetical protein